jgi:putative N-acetylmannosamine-6-phosphate epimerase
MLDSVAQRWPLHRLDPYLKGGLVVSCQPVDGGALDHDESVGRMAQATVAGGARALRLEGARRVAHVRALVEVPIIGIIKRDLALSPVRITPLLDDVAAVCDAGADVVAVDATQRERPCAVRDLLGAIHARGCLAMADASCLNDALHAWDMGFDIVGTTLAGYTGEAVVPSEPDLALVSQLAARGCRVMAEGRLDTPERAAQAIRAGAWAVTVGTALTRLEVMTSWFADQVSSAATQVTAR